MKNEIDKIASHLYQDDQSRAVAKETISHFMTVLRSEDTAKQVMYAFYRREHGKEPCEKDVLELSAKMSVALMAIDSLLTS